MNNTTRGLGRPINYDCSSPDIQNVPFNPLEDITLEDISDAQQRRKIRHIRKLLPSKTNLQVRNALLTCMGNLDQAFALLLSDSATIQASSSFIAATSTTKASLVNGAIQSPKISSATHATSAVLATAGCKAFSYPVIIDPTGETEYETPADWSVKQYPTPSPPFAKDEDHDTVASPIKVEAFKEGLGRLPQPQPGTSLAACKGVLQACDGDTEQTFGLTVEEPAQNYLGVSPNSTKSKSLKSGTNTTPIAQEASANQNRRPLGTREQELSELSAEQLHSHPTKAKGDNELNNPTEDDNNDKVVALNGEYSEAKVEWLFGQLAHRVARGVCRTALQLSDGNEAEAYENLSAELEPWDEHSRQGLRLCRSDGTLASPCKSQMRGQERVTSPECNIPHPKRKAKSPLPRGSKKARGSDAQDEIDTDADDGHEDDKEDEVVGFNLAPASEWIDETYPEATEVVILLGPDRVPRGQIPYQVLYKNFDSLKKCLRAATSRDPGPSKIIITVPEVSPEAFDLAVQFVICDNLNLGDDLNENYITSILDLIQAAIKLRVPRLSALINRMTTSLKLILSRDRLALKGSHIRTAYDLEEQDGTDIQDLFVRATVRRVLEYTPDHPVSFFKDDEDEDMTAAQKAAYSGSNFVFYQERKKIKKFRDSLADQVFECIWSRGIRRLPKKSRKASQIPVPVFTDPLSHKQFML